MTQSQIFTLAKSAGLSDSRAKVAAAIAMAESSGDPNNHNTDASTGDDSYGLWQINMLGALGPERRKKYGLSDNSQLYNPEINAKAMMGESQNGGNFSAWTTYTTLDPKKSYQRFMGNRVIEEWVKPADDQSLLDKLNPVNVAKDYLSIVNKVGTWVSNSENWMRVGYVVGGGVIVVVGLAMVVQSTQAGKAVSGLIPAGRVAKVAKKLS
jgi:hypothetical protein